MTIMTTTIVLSCLIRLCLLSPFWLAPSSAWHASSLIPQPRIVSSCVYLYFFIWLPCLLLSWLAACLGACFLASL